jgi:hypothetical protein
MPQLLEPVHNIRFGFVQKGVANTNSVLLNQRKKILEKSDRLRMGSTAGPSIHEALSFGEVDTRDPILEHVEGFEPHRLGNGKGDTSKQK